MTRTPADDESPWESFDAVVGNWVLRQEGLEELPSAAAGALVAGLEGPALVRLAGMEHATWSEIEPVMRNVYKERGVELPSVERSAKLVADSVMRAILVGTTSVGAGVDRLHDLAVDLAGDSPHAKPMWPDLEWFYAVASCWGDLTEGHVIIDGLSWLADDQTPTDADIERVVLARCAELLAAGGVQIRLL